MSKNSFGMMCWLLGICFGVFCLRVASIVVFFVAVLAGGFIGYISKRVV